MTKSLFTISKGSVQLTNISIICTWKQKEPRPFSQQSSMSRLTGDIYMGKTIYKSSSAPLSLTVHHYKYTYTYGMWNQFKNRNWLSNHLCHTNPNFLPTVKSLNALAKKTIIVAYSQNEVEISVTYLIRHVIGWANYAGYQRPLLHRWSLTHWHGTIL